MKIPKTVYLHVSGEGENQYLQPTLTIADAVEDDGPTKVGMYQLSEIYEYEKQVVKINGNRKRISKRP